MTYNLVKYLLEERFTLGFSRGENDLYFSLYKDYRYCTHIDDFWEQFKEINLEGQTKIIINHVLYIFNNVDCDKFKIDYNSNVHPDTLQAIKLLTL